MPTVTFLPSGRTIDVPAGVKLIDACRRAGFRISAPCGDKGLCGKCRVKVLKGDIPADARQRFCLPARLLDEGWRASCIAADYADLTLEDPRDDQSAGVVLTDFMTREAEGHLNLWEGAALMPEPSTADQRSDEERLLAALGDAVPAGLEVPQPLLARLPAAVRAAGFRCRAVGLGRRLLDVEALDAPAGRRLGLAVDIGTTTLAAALCDLSDGRVLAVASRANPQSLRGDDVISRADYASKGREELHELRRLVVEAIEDMSAEAVRMAEADSEPILAAVGANTVMNHLFLGVTPRALALSPFIPAFRGPVTVCGSQLGWRGERPPLFYIAPNISAYVGGDVTAGMLAHDVARLRGVTLFLDVGTNGEIGLAVDGKVYACATAAGPAFEGARIRQGMRAAPGAISRVGLKPDGSLDIGVVDDTGAALGLCGTGLLDAVAALLAAGVIDEGGRVLDADEAAELPHPPAPGLLAMLFEDAEGMAVWLERPSAANNAGVALTQRDVREFQLAKGAVAAGVQVLLGAAGTGSEAVDRVLLAGGFGNYLDPASALAVGLLPRGIRRDRVRSVGNASLAGTRLCLLSEREREAAAELGRGVEYIELSGREDFQNAFAEEMLFPESGKDL